jgi:glycosyltransferase involved in cell wall biosynthesis
VTLASITFGPEDEAAVARLGRGERSITARPTRGDEPCHLPAVYRWAWSSKLAHQIRDCHRADPFDLAIASHAFTFPFIASLAGATRVIDAHNVEHLVHAQFATLDLPTQERLVALAGPGGDGYAGSDLVELQTFEQEMWAQADAVLCVSEPERSIIDASLGVSRTLLLPNAVHAVDSPSIAPGAGESVVAFGGALNYIPNVDAVVTLLTEVMPLVSESVTGARLVVTGREPTPALVRLCRQHGAEVIADPDDLFAAVSGSVMAVPLRMGAGSRIKVLEARAHGLPVVASALAVEGLDVTGDPGVTIADGPAAIADAIAARFRQRRLIEPPPQPPATWDAVFDGVLDAIGFVA